MADVLIIGAGPAGMSSGYYLEQLGIPYRIVDRADHPGSTWSGLYPALKLNTAAFVSHLPGSHLPLRHGLFPTGRAYYEHFSDWVTRHPLNVSLSVNVERVTPVDGEWRVETQHETSWHPVVILASGRFSNPYYPDIPGLDTFEGTVLHARDFRDPTAFAGQRVLVVGSGPSGADIAVALSQRPKNQIFFAIRSDMVVARRNPYGINDTIWKLLIAALPIGAQRRKWLNDRITFQTYPGIARLELPLAPNRDDRKGTSVPIRGPEWLRAVRNGSIRPVRGLRALVGRCALLDDDSSHEIDVVIFATGYRPALQYLDIRYETDVHGWPLRATQHDPLSTAIRDHAGLFLVGRDYRGFGALYNIRQEARKAAGEIQTYLSRRRAPQPPMAT
jgi:cation diffusion facilitator CzcD-associated flavoprotein CzcO